MATFENEISKIIFFVSSFLDWYTLRKMTSLENRKMCVQ